MNHHALAVIVIVGPMFYSKMLETISCFQLNYYQRFYHNNDDNKDPHYYYFHL